MKANYDIHSYILAGGKSRRFGENKALYNYRGKPLIKYAIDALSGINLPVTIITKETAEYTQFGLDVISDETEMQNPLTGLITGLNNSVSDWAFFLACDMPNIDTESVEKILDIRHQLDDEVDIRSIIPKTPDGYLQTTCACYHKELIGEMQIALEQERSVISVIEKYPCHIIEFDSPLPFKNINRREDLDN